ncbi:kinase-like protein, partial [Calocera viscosa TUFC12733]
GDVSRYLRNNPNADRLDLLRDIAQGLSYLHSLRPPLVHGDLRARNVLVRDSGQACLADFGLSRLLLDVQASESSESSACRGNPRWLAPERLDPNKYGTTHIGSLTPAADVYSFGMVLYEIYTGRLPFHESLYHFDVARKVLEGQRPLHSGNRSTERGPDPIWDIAQDCWKDSWRERPLAEELVPRLTAMVVENRLEVARAEVNWVSIDLLKRLFCL